jgi:hypothetical protein
MDLKGLVILVLAAVVLYLLFAPKMSGFVSDAPAGFAASAPAVSAAPAATDYSTGVVSSAGLIPREVVATEDFGQFSPDTIMSGQNYLDPRSQIGYPETVGGVLRNANLQFRSEPVNPRQPVSIFNLSTIPPDTMRPKFEISPEYQ